MSPQPPVTAIRGLAHRIAAYRALDLIVFEHVGRWGVDADTDASVRPYFAAWSQHHAWHAELWVARFPSIPDADVHSATDDARERFTVAVEALEGAAGSARLELLADRIFPTLASVIDAHRRAVDVRLDAPTARVLDLVTTDVERDRSRAEELRGHQHGEPADDDLGLVAALTAG